jgi:glycosyltransferase involved in cell wall biosynthesis
MARICLITPQHVSFQPRTLREADAFAEAGHDVRVVCRQIEPGLSDFDRELMRSRSWRLQAVGLSRVTHRRAWFVSGMSWKIYQALYRAGLMSSGIVNRSCFKGFESMVRAASGEPTDWLIAHTQSSLAVAAEAKRHLNARLGFDCEDLLTEISGDPSDVVSLIERNYLPLCDYISAPSKCLARELVRAHKVPAPVILYNVFPTSLAAGLRPPNQSQHSPVLRLHWFGQTIGKGRGLEDAFKALEILSIEPVELHLRGRVAVDFQSEIDRLKARQDIGEKVFIHPIVSPSELIRTMDQFDIGLSLERPDHGNYSLAATNKLFSYILGGLGVAATDTPGHREVFEQAPTIGFLYQAGQPETLAAKLRELILDKQALSLLQKNAWDVARKKFCWDVEKQKLLDLVGRTRNDSVHLIQQEPVLGAATVN